MAVTPARANTVAAMTFFAVLVALVVAGLLSGSLLAGSSTPDATTVTQRQTVTEMAGASPPTTTVTERVETTVHGQTDLVGRVLDGPAFWVLRLGFIVLAAFVAGAIVQRVLLARYEFKFGPLEVPSITKEQVSAAGNAVIDALPPAIAAQTLASRSATSSSLLDSTSDPTLRLVALRIEVEGRVRSLLASSGVPRSESLTANIDALCARDVIADDVGGALKDLVTLGNLAAHGVKVDDDAGEWAASQGPAVLEYLDWLIAGSPAGQ